MLDRSDGLGSRGQGLLPPESRPNPNWDIPAAAGPAAAARRRSEALLAEILAIGHQQGVFDVVHLEATAAAIGGMGIRVASWYPPPGAGLSPSQLADVYAALALRMAGARQR